MIEVKNSDLISCDYCDRLLVKPYAKKYVSAGGVFVKYFHAGMCSREFELYMQASNEPVVWEK